jgi:DNA-binding response OmpR family regulator
MHISFAVGYHTGATRWAPRMTLHHSNFKVLVVDDCPDILDLYSFGLEASGFQVFSAADGEHALEMLHKVRPDAALIDLGLPGCDGFEVAAELRKCEDIKDTVLIAHSGFSQVGETRAMEVGFDCFVSKPSDPDTIAALIRDRLLHRGESVSQ